MIFYEEQFYKDIIAGDLPDEATVASKSGFITGVRHDSGIVYLPDGRSYFLVYLSKNVPDEERSVAAGAAVSRMIYDFYMKNPVVIRTVTKINVFKLFVESN